MMAALGLKPFRSPAFACGRVQTPRHVAQVPPGCASAASPRHTLASENTRTHPCSHACSHTRLHMLTNIRTLTRTPPHAHTHTYMLAHTLTHAHKHTHSHTHTRALIHIPTLTHTHTPLHKLQAHNPRSSPRRFSPPPGPAHSQFPLCLSPSCRMQPKWDFLQGASCLSRKTDSFSFVPSMERALVSFPSLTVLCDSGGGGSTAFTSLRFPLRAAEPDAPSRPRHTAGPPCVSEGLDGSEAGPREVAHLTPKDGDRRVGCSQESSPFRRFVKTELLFLCNHFRQTPHRNDDWRD